VEYNEKAELDDDTQFLFFENSTPANKISTLKPTIFNFANKLFLKNIGSIPILQISSQ